MLPSPSFTSIRNYTINEFNLLRSRATRDSWLAKILGRNNGPRSFVASGATGLHGKRLPGIHCIRVENIVGTVHRTDDFDSDFRPLKPHLRDRWVNTLLQLETDGWEPILVHKVGEHYFIKDGHHRVSVAKAIGMLYIEAGVWDHCSSRLPHGPCTSEKKSVKRHVRAYSTNS